MSIIDLPYNFKSYPFQQDLKKAFFSGKYNRFINVWHRRAGKDLTWLNLAIVAAKMRVGTYLHLLPEQTQARKVIWDGIDINGRPYLDYFPDELIASKNKQDMTIRFKNGSVWQLGGADNYNSFRGTNPVHITFSEHSYSHPNAWLAFSPILERNHGTAAFIFTPNGKNHAYDLFSTTQNEEDWYSNLLTIDDTFDIDGNRLYDKDVVIKAAKSGVSQAGIDQEYYCSFESAIQGAYYAKQIRDAQNEGRVCDFVIDNTLPVSTYWDLGIRDSTAIIFVQHRHDGGHDIIWYYENKGEPIEHYINYVHDLRDKLHITYSTHYQPHDSKNRSKQTGQSMVDYERDKYGFPVTPVDRPIHVIDSITAVRMIFPRCRFHATNCYVLLEALKTLAPAWNEQFRIESKYPKETWAIHGCDAFGVFARVNDTSYTPDPLPDRPRPMINRKIVQPFHFK